MKGAAQVFLLLVALQACVGTLAVAQAPVTSTSFYAAREPDVPEKAGKVLRAYPITAAPPVIDGRFDDAVWAMADSASDMV